LIWLCSGLPEVYSTWRTIAGLVWRSATLGAPEFERGPNFDLTNDTSPDGSDRIWKKHCRQDCGRAAGLGVLETDEFIHQRTSRRCTTACRRLAPDGHLLSLQNGLGNLERTAAIVGDRRVLGGRVIFGAEIVEPGRVRVTVEAAPVLIGSRLRERRGHFAGASILGGQFADLEEPREAFTLSAELPPDEIARKILKHFSLLAKSSIDVPSLLKKLRWRLLPFLSPVCGRVSRPHQCGLAALQNEDKLGFSDSVYGLGGEFFFSAIFCFRCRQIYARRRVGARRWISFLMVCWGIISGCMFALPHWWLLYSLRFLLGLPKLDSFQNFYLRSWFRPAREPELSRCS
jgi:hypothetical protein